MEQHSYHFVDWAGQQVICAIPKAGCTSLKEWLFAQNGGVVYGDIHSRLPDARFCLAHHPGADVSGWPVIAVVRDPVARLMSAWQSKFVEHSNAHFRQYAATHSLHSLADFVAHLETVSDLDEENPHWRPQSWFILPQARLVPLERAGEVFPGLPHANATQGRPDIYGLKERICRLYAADTAIYLAACTS